MGIVELSASQIKPRALRFMSGTCLGRRDDECEDMAFEHEWDDELCEEPAERGPSTQCRDDGINECDGGGRDVRRL